MKVDKKKFESIIAKECISLSELSKKAKVSSFTITRMQTGADTRPMTIGKIAKALNVGIEELVETTAATVNQK